MWLLSLAELLRLSRLVEDLTDLAAVVAHLRIPAVVQSNSVVRNLHAGYCLFRLSSRCTFTCLDQSSLAASHFRLDRNGFGCELGHRGCVIRQSH